MASQPSSTYQIAALQQVLDDLNKKLTALPSAANVVQISTVIQELADKIKQTDATIGKRLDDTIVTFKDDAKKRDDALAVTDKQVKDLIAQVTPLTVKLDTLAQQTNDNTVLTTDFLTNTYPADIATFTTAIKDVEQAVAALRKHQQDRHNLSSRDAMPIVSLQRFYDTYPSRQLQESVSFDESKQDVAQIKPQYRPLLAWMAAYGPIVLSSAHDVLVATQAIEPAVDEKLFDSVYTHRSMFTLNDNALYKLLTVT
jgi:DNA repair exonuclease SbcCD ATPase subunit